jgi:hypothetical protein
MKGLLVACLAFGLTSCAMEHDVPPPAAGPLDEAIRTTTGLSTGKVKFTGPVTLQFGGTNNTATSTAIAKAKAPVAAAPHATATETTTRAAPPWYVFAALVLIGAAVGAWLRGKFSFLSFIK